MTPSHEQLARVYRWLHRIEKQGASDEDYDDLLAFFLNCWHLKDWIENDSTLSSAVTGNIEREAEAYESLQICADICNRTKHLKLTRPPREGAEVTRKDIRVTVERGSSAIARYQITDVDGSTWDALDLAKQAV